MLWYGSIATIPSGWALCDGDNGTPNLNAQFVRGAGAGYAPGAVGGANNHVHTFTGDGHSHHLAVGDDITVIPPTGSRYKYTETDPAVGTTDSKDHKPPYTQLCYIMKLPIP